MFLGIRPRDSKHFVFVMLSLVEVQELFASNDAVAILEVTVNSD